MGRLKSSSLQKVQCILNEGQNGGQVDQELRMSSGKKKGSRYFLPGKRHSFYFGRKCHQEFVQREMLFSYDMHVDSFGKKEGKERRRNCNK